MQLDVALSECLVIKLSQLLHRHVAPIHALVGGCLHLIAALLTESLQRAKFSQLTLLLVKPQLEVHDLTPQAFILARKVLLAFIKLPEVAL